MTSVANVSIKKYKQPIKVQIQLLRQWKHIVTNIPVMYEISLRDAAAAEF